MITIRISGSTPEDALEVPPFISGITISVSTTSNCCDSNSCTASTPVDAIVTSNTLFSSSRYANRRTATSSSKDIRPASLRAHCCWQGHPMDPVPQAIYSKGVPPSRFDINVSAVLRHDSIDDQAGSTSISCFLPEEWFKNAGFVDSPSTSGIAHSV